jgi:hypothetical protein
MKAPQNLKWDKPRGPRWLREVIDKLFRELTSRTPVEGLGVYVERTENGSIISTGNQPGGKSPAAAAASAAQHPFQVIPGEPFEVKYVPGVVETTVPTLGSGLPISDPAAVITEGAGTTTLVLRVTFVYDTDERRYKITAADIDAYEIPDPPLVWDDPAEEKNGGVCYIQASAVTFDGDGQLTNVLEYLRDHIRVLAILGNYVYTFS